MRGSLAVGVALAGLAGAGVAAVVLPDAPYPLDGEPAAIAFLDAWERSRVGTFVVQSTFRREMRDGPHIEATTTIVSRPPDRLSIGLGGVEGTLDGHVVRCATDTAGDFECFDGGVAGAYEDEVGDELANLADAVLGARPLYRVHADGKGCFGLTLALAFPSPPYGERAEFCFDGDTGAPSYSEVLRGDVLDTTIATSIRGEVTATDLEIPDDAGGLPEPEE